MRRSNWERTKVEVSSGKNNNTSRVLKLQILITARSNLHHNICAYETPILQASCTAGGEDDSNNKAIESKSFSENENENHPDEKFGLLCIGPVGSEKELKHKLILVELVDLHHGSIGLCTVNATVMNHMTHDLKLLYAASSATTAKRQMKLSLPNTGITNDSNGHTSRKASEATSKARRKICTSRERIDVQENTRAAAAPRKPKNGAVSSPLKADDIFSGAFESGFDRICSDGVIDRI
nr:hypothetical protein Ccrd_009249 [Ipomoea batatas]